jgi:acyl carrier protein
MEVRMIDPRIIDVIRRVTKNSDITIENIKDPFMVLGWDSLMSIEILLEIQKTFGIQVEPNEILRIKNLLDLHKLIQEKQKTDIYALSG